MKYSAVLFLFVLFAPHLFAQTPKPSKRTIAVNKNGGNEKEEFERATATKNATARIAALQKFIEKFPKSTEIIYASELILIARATLADEKLQAKDAAGGIELFKLAVRELPKPVSDKFFTEVLLQIPNNLFFRGERAAAIETAKLVEEKADGNAKQTLALATFYLGMENAAEAKRLANKALQIEPNLPAAYQTLGLANRLNFEFEAAATAYAKALELNADSAVSKRSLAEIKRALGKPAEAVEIYRDILSKNEADAAARTGLILALFDAENRAEAETEMEKSLAENPSNLFLFVGAAYWYAAHNESAKAIEFAEKAIILEPRYTWAHIALARGLTLQKRSVEAEKALLDAKQYGNFPTLDYELASVRLAAGFYREAAEELQKNFTVKDDFITTRLGGRVSASAKTFTELLSPERRAGIFQFTAADTSENAERLKSLLNLMQKLDDADEATINDAANEFVKGDDKMKTHRQLFAAQQLLQKKKSLPKVLELTKAAVAGVDSSLDVPNPVAAVLADELYESRTLAISRGKLILIPDVSRQTLSNILRGRIEDITGWALFETNKPAEAAVRLKRAVGILPEKSAWWRNAMWHYGAALEADGKSREALDAYIKTYTTSEADAGKYAVIESLYQKVNGNTDGLEARIGAKPVPVDSPIQIENQSAEKTKVVSQTTTETKPETKIEMPTEAKTAPAPVSPETPQPVAENKLTPETPKSEAPVRVEETKIEPPPETKPEIIPTEQKPETKDIPIEPQPEVKTDSQKTETQTETPKPQPSEEKPAQNSSKSLFEPIIINVPKFEPVKKPESTETEKPKTEIKPDETVQEKKPITETVENRPRVIVEDTIKTVSPCRLLVNQENISIFKERGSLGVLVNFDGEGDLNQITAASNSPTDVEVKAEPEIGALSNKAFFIVQSISAKTGTFKVVFEAPCGKKEVSVKVR